MKFKRDFMLYSGVVLATIIIGINYYNIHKRNMDEFNGYLKDIKINTNNSDSILNSMKEKAQYLGENTGEDVEINRVTSKEIKSSIANAEVNILSVWSSYLDSERDLFSEPTEIESTDETSRNSTYIEEDSGNIIEITEEESTSESNGETFNNVSETLSENEVQIDETEETDTFKAKTLVLLKVSGFNRNDTLEFKIYNKDNPEEALSIKSKTVSSTDNYNKSRIDLIEIDGDFYCDDLCYEIVDKNGKSSGIRDMELTQTLRDDRYSIMKTGGDRVVLIKNSAYNAGNRIELVRTTKFGEVVYRGLEETTLEEKKVIESSEESTEPSTEFGPIVESEVAEQLIEPFNLDETESNLPSFGVTDSLEESTEEETKETGRIIESNDEMYHMMSSYTIFGNSDDIKNVIDNNIHFYDSMDGSDIDFLDSFQVKWSKEEISEDGNYVSIDFSVGVRVLKSKLDEYMLSTHRGNIYGSTITEIKSKFGKVFKLILESDNSIDFEF